MFDLDVRVQNSNADEQWHSLFPEFSFEYSRKSCSSALVVEPVGKDTVCLKEAGLVTLIPPNAQGAPKMLCTVLYIVLC